MGSIYLRGNTYWIKYYSNGKPYRESAKTDKETEAKRLLKLREGQIQEGKFAGLQINKTRLKDLKDGFLADYKIKGRKSLERAEICFKHLEDFFGNCKVTDITTSWIKEYINKKQNEGLSNGTINRTLAALKRSFTIALKETYPPIVTHIPYIPMLKEANPRTGFFSHEEYLAILEKLPSYIKSVFKMAYFTGMRKEEILGLKWEQVNLFDKTITLEPEKTKNNEARVLYLTGELLETILEQFNNKKGDYVFHRNGHKIEDFRHVWRKAFKKAKIPEKLFHDLRRTAVRNMIRSGIPEKVAMMISGHKTRSIFDRYNIVDETDLKVAAIKISDYHRENEEMLKKIEMGTITGTIAFSEYRKA
ncbi:MAG: tyrosine-type recombinase/integrase [Syntrophorhabdaceae bacterium]|nr:tyrosine-type recombinase/integrase [Syntrophorhabdaceae bacterium]